jgi:hypothetical protein
MAHRQIRRRFRVVAVAALLTAASGALAQPSSTTPALQASGAVRDTNPSRATMLRLTNQRFTIEFAEKRLEEVVTFIKDATGADLEPLWIDDRNSGGLDKDKTISLKLENRTALEAIERILERAADRPGETTWQMSESGALQLGTKERLNQSKRLVVYDLRDLLFEVPDFTDAPTIDLQQALQNAGRGGGGGQSPFNNAQNDNNRGLRMENRAAQAERIMQLVRDLVETEQWTENGGTGGSMQYYQGSVLITAADYMHRGINGYPWWPSTATRVAQSDGRRSVTLAGDTESRSTEPARATTTTPPASAPR